MSGDYDWLTDRQTDSFWSAVLLAQSAELEMYCFEWPYHEAAAGAIDLHSQCVCVVDVNVKINQSINQSIYIAP